MTALAGAVQTSPGVCELTGRAYSRGAANEDERWTRQKPQPPIQAMVAPVTPLQQNCTIVWCTKTRKAAVIDPGGEVPSACSRRSKTRA